VLEPPRRHDQRRRQHRGDTVEIVEVRSDQEYAGRPLALHWEGKRRVIVDLFQTWREPQGKRFLVRTEDDLIFELFYREENGEWLVKLL
jgi:hypothetical protein